MSPNDADPVNSTPHTHAEGKPVESAQARPHWADSIIAIMTVLIFFTYITSNYFACRQLKLTRKAISDSVDSSTKTLEQMKLQTMAQRDAAKAATDSVKATLDTLHFEQRAWVAAVDIRGIPELDKPFEINLTTKNTGRTFAKDFGVVAVAEGVSKGKNPDFSGELSHKPNGIALLAPNGDFTTTLYPIGDEKINKADIDALKSGTIRPFIHGRIMYKDIFDCPHWTTFCVRLMPNFKYQVCETHNDADQNACPVTPGASLKP